MTCIQAAAIAAAVGLLSLLGPLHDRLQAAGHEQVAVHTGLDPDGHLRWALVLCSVLVLFALTIVAKHALRDAHDSALSKDDYIRCL